MTFRLGAGWRSLIFSTFSQLSRSAFALVVCGALVAIACSGDAPYAPLENDKAPRAAIVGGTVRNMSEEPVAAAVVTLEPMDDGISATAKWMLDRPGATSEDVPGRRVTLTSESGHYAFDDVADGEYVLQVLADDHLGAFKNFTISSTIALADTVIINVNLTPTGKFSGNAFLEGTTNYANTIVYVEGTSYVAVTNPTGGYTISGVPVASYSVRAAHPAYLDETRNGTISTAGQTVTLSDMTLEIDPNIAPVARASAASQACELDPVPLSGAASTDKDGSIVSYSWDFEDDGSVDFTSANAGTSHAYPPGTHRAKLRVTDNHGAFGFDVVTFSVVQAESVFVATTGNDANPGTRSQPKQTIAAGLAAAVVDTVGVCPAVVVVSGDYTESPVFLPDMRVLGGFDSSTWTRAANSYSMVNVQLNPALAENLNSAAAATTLSGFDFRAANGINGPFMPRNSIAMRVVNSSALTLADCRFQSGNGAAGQTGVTGIPGTNGGNGSSPGGGGGGGSPGGLVGGNGGGPSTAGQTGGGGCGTGGYAGFSWICSSTFPGDGGPGGDGCIGVNGANGAAQISLGDAGAFWVSLSGLDGVDGTSGGGGGGGGGGGNIIPSGLPQCNFGVQGGAGGGGGGGGGSATAGIGGGGGGASFAVYLFDSSPVFTDCHFTTGAGGVGGAGGNGGAGGSGGIGGTGAVTQASRGGNGGAGGNGGHGGAGSGGPGGPSYCVYRAGSSNPTLTGSVFVVGSGGTGGAAGMRPDNVPAAAGLNAPAGTVGP